MPDMMTDPEKEMKIRRLTMALMGRQGMGAQPPANNLFGGLSQGLNAGQGMAQQQELNSLMGLPSPWERMKGWFGGGGSEPPPGSMSYGGPR